MPSSRTPTPPDLIVSLARTYLGTPFRHIGRSRDGLDCVGLVILVGKELGLIDYDVRAYARQPDGVTFRSYFREAGLVETAWRDRQPGDVVLMHDGRYPCHTAILTSRDPDSVIHAYAARRKVQEEKLGGYLMSRLIGAYRYPGVEAAEAA